MSITNKIHHFKKMPTQFQKLMTATLGEVRQIDEEWKLAKCNIDLLSDKDLRYFCSLASVKGYGVMRRVDKLAGLQPHFDKYSRKKVDRNRLPVSRKITNIPPVAKSEIKPIRRGTKQQLVVEALLKGATIDCLAKVTGWDRKSAHGQVHGGLSGKKGYGIIQKGDKYHLVLPAGMTEVLYS